MAEHKRLHAETGVPIYFCDPKSPWQRGTNENTNGLLRQYFPKRIANLSDYSQHDYDQVADELNNRPRKILDYRTPAEAMHHLAPPRPSDAVVMSCADVKRAEP